MRPIPAVAWRGVLVAVAFLTGAATAGWELYARSAGYGASINDTADLWAQQRAKVRPDSVVIVGTSRALFDLDLDVLEQGLGQRPLQLALAGSSPYPVLADLANDESFRGTVIVDIVPAMFLAPGGPPMEVSTKALARHRDQTYAQLWSHHLGLALEENIAFLKQEDLTLAQLLKRLPIPDRAGARIGPKLPPYFYAVDRDRRGRMVESAAVVGSALNQEVRSVWLPLFTPPPPPPSIPAEKFAAMMGQAMERRFADANDAIKRLRSRGATVVFVRLPVTGPLAEREEQLVPLPAGWGRLVRENGVPAINFADHADLSAFDCPEWSHLSAADSVEFTKRLVPHLRRALAEPSGNILATTPPGGARPASS
ncbi:MAG TPA: hypothetical protein VEB66_12625 [Opitutaceae bacterium]|nr:hypothetical protein [Opitutaceae bacterium]